MHTMRTSVHHLYDICIQLRMAHGRIVQYYFRVLGVLLFTLQYSYCTQVQVTETESMDRHVL